MPDLSTTLATLPTSPGVYLFMDREGRVIYVGKAKNLRLRVRSYFRDSAHDGRPLFTAIVRNTVDIDCLVTESEQEALVLEATQIKTHAPRFNIKLKDDKKYPFIRITCETFPRIFPTRDIVDDGSRYLGPYSNVKAMHKSLALMHKLFPVRTCDYKLPKSSVKVCLEYRIKRCEGPCEDYVSEDSYRHTIEHAVRFLKGNNKGVLHELARDMETAAQALRYEEAARYRDTITSLKATSERRARLIEGDVDRDVIGLGRDDHEACCFVLEIREGMAGHQKHHLLANAIDASDEAIVSSFVRQFYLESDFIPPEIHLPCPIADADAIGLWLSERGERVHLHSPQRGEKADAMRMATANASQVLEQRRLKRELRRDVIPNGILALQRDLNLPHPPRRIEAIDISTFQGDCKVGSLVCMIDGRPRKSEYRSFTIRSVQGIDDFASIKEVVYRRFRGLAERNEQLPDLLLIDGGKGQLTSAGEALDELGMGDQPIIGLAKRLEEVFVRGEKKAVLLPKTSAGLRTLQILRDEAHRFALNHHRHQRQKQTMRSALDSIPGVGPKRKRALLRTLGSVASIQKASAEEIGDVPGIGHALARVIKSALSK
jgi:excinuclease ABC subunit C